MGTNARLFWILAGFFFAADAAYIIWSLVQSTRPAASAAPASPFSAAEGAGACDGGEGVGESSPTLVRSTAGGSWGTGAGGDGRIVWRSARVGGLVGARCRT